MSLKQQVLLAQEQIRQLPQLCERVKGTHLFERICTYLRELYLLDIQYLPIRSMGAALGWLWPAASVFGRCIMLVIGMR